MLLLGYLVSLIVRRNGVTWTLIDGWGVSSFELLAGFLVLTRALRSPRYRRFGLVLGTGMCFWASGDFALSEHSLNIRLHGVLLAGQMAAPLRVHLILHMDPSRPGPGHFANGFVRIAPTSIGID